MTHVNIYCPYKQDISVDILINHSGRIVRGLSSLRKISLEKVCLRIFWLKL